MKELELYLHIPFCRQKCSYCDFVSFAGCESYYDRYTEAVCREIRAVAPEYKDRRIISVYIGGGTPSVLSCGQIEKILGCLMDSFQVRDFREKKKGLFLQKKVLPQTEISIEANPESLDPEKLRTYRRMGVNRLSIGLQSASDRDLKTLGRIHDFDTFTKAFEMARRAGFSNINIDLMQAIPGQSLAEWKRVLAIAGTFQPEHLSAYSLIIEEGTAFDRLLQEGKLDLPDEDTEREIYYYTREFLSKAGYQRYEISNYARPGFACRHNEGYWTRTDYLGLGLHASSLINNTRWKNTDQLEQYLSWEGKAPERIREEKESLSREEQMEEFMFLGLRMTQGVSRRRFFELFGQDLDYTYKEVLPKLKAMDLIRSEGDTVCLTDRGVDVSNTVLAEFLLTS